MPYQIDSYPEQPRAISRHAMFKPYMDGNVWVFQATDAVDFDVDVASQDIKGEWRKHGTEEILKSMRNGITTATRHYHGSYMYRARIYDSKLFYMFGETECRVGFCKETSETNEPHCAMHRGYNYYEAKGKRSYDAHPSNYEGDR